MENDSTTYTQTLKEVEKLVSDVSSGNLDLDTMVLKVEKGFQLIANLRQKLDDTKLKIETLKEKFIETTDKTNHSTTTDSEDES